MSPNKLSARDALHKMAQGTLTAEVLMRACLEAITRREPEVQAWQFLDAERALRRACAADAARKSGQPLGPLHGLPVGVKDVIDTADMRTEHGTILHAGRRPAADAFVVARLRAAGAIVVGKTVTTELAIFAPGKTRNPHDPARTPGGSSSGSAAAVAAGMVPLSIGTQANGSVIRPAAYCGVWGLKVSHGLVSQTGMLRQSPFLNHAGIFARSAADIALALETLVAPDLADPTLREQAPEFLAAATAPTVRTPRLALAQTPWWDRADAEVRTLFAAVRRELGSQAELVVLPPSFDSAIAEHRVLVESDLAYNLRDEYDRGRDVLSPVLRGMIENGHRHPATRYAEALDARARLVADIAPILNSFDALVVPATTGSAPVGLGATGDPVYCTAWTLAGLPALAVPSFSPVTGLPIGLQAIGRMGEDARLLQISHWLSQRLSSLLNPQGWRVSPDGAE